MKRIFEQRDRLLREIKQYPEMKVRRVFGRVLSGILKFVGVNDGGIE
jgi:hypothetical protein